MIRPPIHPTTRLRRALVPSRRAIHGALAVALGAVGLFATAATAAEEGPREVIQLTVAQVLEVLGNGEATAVRRAKLETIVYARFDFPTMSRLVLARNWKRFSKEQQEEFIAEYKSYLANNYGERLDRYNQEKVDITGQRDEPRGDVTVHTKIVGGEFNGALVDYRLRGKTGKWLVIDVTVEGVSLVSNFRDQFKEVLSKGGPDGLLDALKKKNAATAAEESAGGSEA
jgi:phospholipid transport system substrate-binding protein